MKTGLTTTVDNWSGFFAAVETLVGTRVMVGVPAEKTDRKDGSLTNAALAYIHDKGAPEANVPARPFMDPGVKRVQAETVAMLRKAGELAFTSGAAAVERQLHRVGLLNQASIRSVISEGIPPPLAPSTIARRIARVKGKKRRVAIDAAQAAGTPDSRQLGAEGIFTPLIVTAQLLKSITYVLRKTQTKLGGLPK